MTRACTLSGVGFLLVAGAVGSWDNCRYRSEGGKFSNAEYLGNIRGQTRDTCENLCTNWRSQCNKFAVGQLGNHVVWGTCRKACGGFAMHRDSPGTCTLFPFGVSTHSTSRYTWYVKKCNGGNANCRDFAGKWANEQNHKAGGIYTIEVNNGCGATVRNRQATWSPASGRIDNGVLSVSFGGIRMQGRLTGYRNTIQWNPNNKQWTRQRYSRLVETVPSLQSKLYSAALPLLGIAAISAVVFGALVVRRRARRATPATATDAAAPEGEDVEVTNAPLLE